MLIFRQLFDPVSSTYTYLLADQGQALLIDPVFEHARRDRALLRELGLQLLATLETHVHADHVTGAWLLKQQCGSRIAVSAAAGTGTSPGTSSEASTAAGDTCADRLLQHGDTVKFGSRHLQVRATPGHTAGCLSYVLDDHSMAFTGDALLIRGCGRTDFQQGSPQTLFRSVREQLLSLPESCLLYPGHDYRGLTATSVAEEKRFNPRLGGDASEGDFIGYMNHLGLPHPKLMDVAVPANLQCGRPQSETSTPEPAEEEPNWAPLTYSFGGIWEIQPAALEECLAAHGGAAIQLLDVREVSEFEGGLGHIASARLLPLDSLAGALDALDREQPVVAVCRSGTRSAQATVMLQKAGFKQAANLAGGMLRWRAQGLQVQGGQS